MLPRPSLGSWATMERAWRRLPGARGSRRAPFISTSTPSARSSPCWWKTWGSACAPRLARLLKLFRIDWRLSNAAKPRFSSLPQRIAASTGLCRRRNVLRPRRRRPTTWGSAAATRGLRAAMEVRTVRSMDPEALAYALMGIGHFVALRWIIWPQEGGETTEGAPPLPEEVFNTVIEFMMHGLAKPADEGK